MFLWMAADLGNALGAIRERALAENRQWGLSEVAFTLPAHISLKISFSVPQEKSEPLQREAEAIFREIPSFSVRVKGLQQAPGVLWIAMEENEALRWLHEKMVGLARKYGAEPHPFDGDFRYHSTLFLSQEAEKLAQMAAALQDAPLPEQIAVRAFLIGGSETGKAGEYRVFRRIPAAE